MKCSKEIRICPEGWRECELCAHQRACIAGLYVPEQTDIEVLIRAAKIAEEVVTKEAIESAHNIKRTWFEEFSQMSGEERWAEFLRYHTPSLMGKEVLPVGEGRPGGGSKSKVKKSTKGTKKAVYAWGEFK